ncbi:E set domain-containing protein [Backusella circina FSU 941]|nr:E set domain-containing protein [Backusella circina FSU 941]
MQHLKSSKDDPTITLELDPSFTGILRGVAHDESEGCTVKGVCRVKVSKEIKVRRLVVWLEGRCKVTLKSSGYSVANTEGTESRTLYSRDRVYLGKNGISESLAPGEYVYPFSFDIPPTLPSSYRGKRGYIRYRLQASIYRFMFSSDIQTSLDVTIKRCLLTDQTPMAELRETYEGLHHTNKLHYNATAPSISYREGGLVRLNLTMQLTRPETQSVQTVTCALRERVQYRTTDSHSNTMISKTDNLFPLEYSTFHPSQERDYNPELKADYNALFRLCPRVNADLNSRLIRVTHDLVVNIVVNDKATDEDDSESVYDTEVTDSEWGTEDERPSTDNNNDAGEASASTPPISIPNSPALSRSSSATSLASLFSLGRNHSSASLEDLVTSGMTSLSKSSRRRRKQKRNLNEPNLTICSLAVPLVVTCREQTWNNRPAQPPSYNSTEEPPSYGSTVHDLPPVPVYDPATSRTENVSSEVVNHG